MTASQEDRAAGDGAAKPRATKRKLAVAALVVLYAIPVNLYALFTAQIGGFGKAMVVLVEIAVLAAAWYFIFRYRPNPLTERKLRNFQAIKRGYNSFLIIAFLLLITFLGSGSCW